MSSVTTIPLAVDLTVSPWRRRGLLPTAVGLVLGIALARAGSPLAGLAGGTAMAAMTYGVLRIADRSSRVTFVVGAGKLKVTGDHFAETYALAELDLAGAQAVDLSEPGPYRLKWKTLGTGMPGYYSGEYALANGSPAVVFISDRKRVLHIPRRAAPALMVSVPDPLAFRQLLLEARTA